MVYIKVMQGDSIIAAEAHDSPAFVCRQARNKLLIRCSEQNAQGILSLDGSTVYQLNGKTSLSIENGYMAYLIYVTDYENIIAEMEGKDEEDTNPEVPEDTTGDEILTRAELTAKVLLLEEELQAAKILLGVSE